jgi:hypothetical protein
MLQQMTLSEPQKNHLQITYSHIGLDIEMEDLKCNK